MKINKVLIIGLACSLTCGCVNILGARNPFADKMKVEECYQSTRIAAGATMIVAFPQLMSDNPRDYHFMADNFLTIPLSVVVLADTICEVPFDTLFLPYDFYASRKESCK